MLLCGGRESHVYRPTATHHAAVAMPKLDILVRLVLSSTPFNSLRIQPVFDRRVLWVSDYCGIGFAIVGRQFPLPLTGGRIFDDVRLGPLDRRCRTIHS